MGAEGLKKLGRNMWRVGLIIVLLGALMATAVYQLNRVGVSSVWAVLLAAALTAGFFWLFADAPVRPTLGVVAFSFGPHSLRGPLEG